MIQKIVAGNSLYIKWTIQKNSNMVFQNPSVVLQDVFKKKVPFTYAIEDKGTGLVITGTYQGKDQKTFGKYNLIFYNNYGEDDQNCLVYKDAFILVHALKKGISSYSDPDADNAFLLEINSDLCLEFVDQNIHDREDIIQALSEITVLNDEQTQIINDISTRINASLNSIVEQIDNLSIDSLDQLLTDIENDEEALVNYLAIIDNSVNEQKELIENNSNNIDDVSIRFKNFKDNDFDSLRTNIYNVSTYARNVSTHLNNVSTRLNTLATEISDAISYDDTDLVNAILDLSTLMNEQAIAQSDNLQVFGGRITNVSTYAINTSTRLKDVSSRLDGLSQVVDNLVDDPGYDDSIIKGRIADVSSYSINVSSRLDSLTESFEYERNARKEDDDAMDDRIENISSYSINVSSRLNDLSTFAHNITPGSEAYDDTNIKARIADVSQYGIDISTDLAVQKGYIESTRQAQAECSSDILHINSSITDISTKLINANSSLSDLSTRLYTVEHNGGGSGEVDLTDVNSSISDLSTRINQLERAEYATNPFYYTSFDVLSKGVSSFNTSSFLFHDVIVNVSSLQSNSAASTSNWRINLFDTVASTTGHHVSAKLAYASTPPKTFVNYNNQSIDVTKYGTYVGNSVNGITGKFYAYHFPHLMKISSQNSSVPDVSNQVSFRIEDPS